MIELYDLFQKSTGISTDTRTLKKGNIFFALKGENFDGNKFAIKAIEDGAIAAVVDDNNLKKFDNIFYVDDSLIALTELAKTHRNKLKCPILAITGSNGKTTTKELTAAVISKKYKLSFTRGNLNNHIGVPLTILNTPNDTEFLIVEMGANHIGDVEALCKIAKPDYGLITNIGKAHLEGFGSIEGVFKAKTELFNHINSFGKGVFLNKNDDFLAKANVKNCLTSYGVKNADVIGTITKLNPFLEIDCQLTNEIIKVQTKLFGSYNLYNVLAAVTIGKYFGVSNELISMAIKEYTPSNFRSQTIFSEKGNNIILDAYNANPSSMKFALQDFVNLESESKLVILGSMLELGEFSSKEHYNILNFLKENKLNSALLFGNEFYEFKSEFSNFDFFVDKQELINHIKANSYKNQDIIIKGSRGVALEKLIEYL